VQHAQRLGSWRWNLKPGEKQELSKTYDTEELVDPDGEDPDDVCGICRVAYEGCCPECKKPGDDCPLIFGECTHIFHMHCLLKWLNTESSKNLCPMDRKEWVTVGSKVAKEGAASRNSTPRAA
jgi:anaphase-promoting complex subunit 11